MHFKKLYRCGAQPQLRLRMSNISFYSQGLYGSVRCLLGAGLLVVASMAKADTPLTLNDAVAISLQNDPWLQGSLYQQQAMLERSVALGALPDPRFSVTLANLPTNTADFNQEAMTQLKFGVTQLLPRGDTLSIKQARQEVAASKQSFLRDNRKAQVERDVSLLWLDAIKADKTAALIESELPWVEKVLDVARSNYAFGIGAARQHDVVQAQMSVTQLQERLLRQQQSLSAALAGITQWLYPAALPASERFVGRLPDSLPALERPTPPETDAQRMDLLRQHPLLRAAGVDQQVKAQDIALAREQYKPQWAVSAGYSYRDDAPNGPSRADLFSIGISFDLPLFASQKQDRNVAASIAESEAVKTEAVLLTNQMQSAMHSEMRTLASLEKRHRLFERTLLAQATSLAELTLNAYTLDDGEISAALQARVTGMNTRIAALDIAVERLKSIVRLNYLLTQSGAERAGE